MSLGFTPAALFTQETRHLRIQTGLGDDVLLLRQLTGSEGISQLFCLNWICYPKMGQLIL